MRRTDAAVWRGWQLFPGVVKYSTGLEGPDKASSMLGRQMMLPLQQRGRGLCMQSCEVSDATFVAGTGQAERNLKGRPAARGRLRLRGLAAPLCGRCGCCRAVDAVDAVEQTARAVCGAVRMDRSCEGPASEVLGQQGGIAWGAAARDEVGGCLTPCRLAVRLRTQLHPGAERSCQAPHSVRRARSGLLAIDRQPRRPHGTQQRHVRCVCLAPPGAPCSR